MGLLSSLWTNETSNQTVSILASSLIGAGQASQAFKTNVEIVRYVPKGANTIRSGDWVMIGRDSFANRMMSGKIFSSSTKAITKTVPRSALKSPPGIEGPKSILGQRIYKP